MVSTSGLVSEVRMIRSFSINWALRSNTAWDSIHSRSLQVGSLMVSVAAKRSASINRTWSAGLCRHCLDPRHFGLSDGGMFSNDSIGDGSVIVILPPRSHGAIYGFLFQTTESVLQYRHLPVFLKYLAVSLLRAVRRRRGSRVLFCRRVLSAVNTEGTGSGFLSFYGLGGV
jgi:hypothetical protein